jgi:uncharacterized secreted protein with C-terminal beta-propeller domain
MNRFFVFALGSLACACTGDDTAPSARLVPMASCEAAADYVKEVAIERMNANIDAALQGYIAGNSCWYGEDDQSPTAGGSGSGGGGGSGSGGGGPTQGTGTNNQVVGVDEADFVKNDGQFIYLAQNGALRIVDAWPANEAHTVSTTPLEGTMKKLFVEGDKALVYAALGDNGNNWYSRDCTYGYDCDFSGDGTNTRLYVLDIANRAAPVLERQIDLTGSLVAARRVGTAVHTVVTSAANLFPDLDYYPETDLCDYTTAKPGIGAILRAQSVYEELRERNRQRIMDTDVAVNLPSVVDTAGAVETTGPSCESLYASSMHDGGAYKSIVSVDMTHPGPVKTATIISRAGAVYASADALYIAVAHSWDEADLSTIHKFRISEIAGQTKYLASGSVHGRALNQFAMDEQDGFLRIATTDGHAPDPEAVSYMSVLDEQHDDLVTVGEIGGIAPTEDIRSVRFDGHRAFVVTFKKTDPLFAFDLSNPSAPHKLGELKIPGFSTYMHMLDDTHLLTIGYDADDHGTFAFFDGIMLQIFDVSDMTAPALSHKFVIGTRGSSSEALTNHLAFTWYPEESLLALPMTVCEGGDDGQYGQTMSFNGLMVFDASVPAGFAEHGRVPHAVAAGITCGNWWTNAESTVKRSLFLDNFVYSISDSELKVRDVGALGTELVTVPLQ